MPPTEKNNRLANFDYENYVLVYAGENGTSRSANKKTHYLQLRAAPGPDLQADRRCLARSCGRASASPISRARTRPATSITSTCRSSSRRTCSTRPTRSTSCRRADDRQPVSADRPGQADDDGGAHRGQPSRARAQLRERDGLRRAVASRHRAAAVLDAARSNSSYAGSAAKHLMLCYNPNEIQPGPGSQDSRRLLQPIASVSNMLQCDPRNRSTFHAGTLKLQQRFSDGTSSWSAIPTASRSTTAPRRRAAAARSATARRSPTWTRGTARPASTSAIARSSATSTSCRSGPAAAGWPIPAA